MLPAQLHLTLPPWVHELDARARYPTDDDRMRLAIALAERNVAMRTGGPFGAALFDQDGRVLAIGMNRVLEQNCSLAHAEIMAIMLAQQRLQAARLNVDGRQVTLATSAQPCCQCYGALVWAGIWTGWLG